MEIKCLLHIEDSILGWGKDEVDGALDPLSCFFLLREREIKMLPTWYANQTKKFWFIFLFLTFLVTAQEPYKGADKVYIWLTLMVQ